MLLFYVRHGDPVYTPDSLTPLGREQANALAKRFALYGLDEIYASDSTRAVQTAEPTALLLKKEIVLCPWANEGLAWGRFTVETEGGGRTWCFHDDKTKDLFNHPEVRALGAKWYDHPFFEQTNFKEGVKQTDEAVDAFLLSLGFSHDRTMGSYQKVKDAPQRVALFAHQGMGLAVLSSILDIPYPQVCTHFDLGHSSMTVLHFDESKSSVYPKILQSSNDSHLYREGILTGYHNCIRF